MENTIKNEFAIIENNHVDSSINHVGQLLRSKDIRFKFDFCLWFIGSSLYNVAHPKYGRHQLTRQQLRDCTGDYKNNLWNNIADAIGNEIDIMEGFSGPVFKRLSGSTQKHIVDIVENASLHS